MANKHLFASLIGRMFPNTTGMNNANAPAYELSPRHALAQYAVSGCLHSTFYTTAEEQLEQVFVLCRDVDAEWIAKVAVFAREYGYMKDMPAVLCAVLAVRDTALLKRVFHRVIDNGTMLRNFVQIIRSGVVGRKSLGSVPKKLILEWLEHRSDEELFRASVGNNPSLADVIKMVHPRPSTSEREALYAYIIGRRVREELLPACVQAYEAFKQGNTDAVPNVPFQMLTSLPLDTAAWCAIARNASWQATRMNLNTFARHGVLEVEGMDALLAKRLSNPEAIRKARAFPYQLLAAWTAAERSVPPILREALHDAMECATDNIPALDGTVYICPDVSGSMHSPVTGYRQGATSAVRCIDVAALVAAAVLRKNPRAEVLPFHDKVVDVRLSGRDSVMTNATKLASIDSGGTNCSAPLAWLNARSAKGDVVVYISDNESWMDAHTVARGTAMMHEWNVFKQRNPNARLVCIDIVPNKTTQAMERDDILNIGGFSDHVFTVLSLFAQGEYYAGHWVEEIEQTAL